MIIWGTRGVTTTKGSGDFHCPHCNARQNYHHKKLQRFFTLYFIPLIPMDTLAEYVQCQTCQGEFKTVVLQYDPEIERSARREQLNAHYRAVLVHFARMANRRDPEFLERVAQLFRGFADAADITAAEVAGDLDGDPLEDIVPAADRLAPFLNERGREELMFGLVEVVGPLTDHKRQALVAAARALGMSEAHLRGVMAAGQPIRPRDNGAGKV